MGMPTWESGILSPLTSHISPLAFQALTAAAMATRDAKRAR